MKGAITPPFLPGSLKVEESLFTEVRKVGFRKRELEEKRNVGQAGFCLGEKTS